MKPQLILLSVFGVLFSFLSLAANAGDGRTITYHTDRRERLIPMTQTTIYIKDPKIKSKKYVYNMTTRKVSRAPAGKLLPSQVSVESSQSHQATQAADQETVDAGMGIALKVKNKRSIASE